MAKGGQVYLDLSKYEYNEVITLNDKELKEIKEKFNLSLDKTLLVKFKTRENRKGSYQIAFDKYAFERSIKFKCGYYTSMEPIEEGELYSVNINFLLKTLTIDLYEL